MDTDLPRNGSASPDWEPPVRRRRKPAPKPGMTLETIRTNMAARMAKEHLADNESIEAFLRTNPRCALHVGELELNLRTTNALVEKAGIERVLELLFCTRQELLAIPGIGENSLEEIYAALAENGFQRQKSPAAQSDPADATSAERTGNGEATAQ